MYVALRSFKVKRGGTLENVRRAGRLVTEMVGGEYVEVRAGELVPEAADWPNLHSFINSRYVRLMTVAEQEAQLRADELRNTAKAENNATDRARAKRTPPGKKRAYRKKGQEAAVV